MNTMRIREEASVEDRKAGREIWEDVQILSPSTVARRDACHHRVSPEKGRCLRPSQREEVQEGLPVEAPPSK